MTVNGDLRRPRKGNSRTAAGLYSPAELAKALGCSEWWVKEQARRRRIPFTWIGGSYRFTREHLSEIISIFEVRPTEEAAQETVPRRRAPRMPATTQAAPILRAKQPRRSARPPEPSSSSAA